MIKFLIVYLSTKTRNLMSNMMVMNFVISYRLLWMLYSYTVIQTLSNTSDWLGVIIQNRDTVFFSYQQNGSGDLVFFQSSGEMLDMFPANHINTRCFWKVPQALSTHSWYLFSSWSFCCFRQIISKFSIYWGKRSPLFTWTHPYGIGIQIHRWHENQGFLDRCWSEQKSPTSIPLCLQFWDAKHGAGILTESCTPKMTQMYPNVA